MKPEELAGELPRAARPASPDGLIERLRVQAVKLPEMPTTTGSYPRGFRAAFRALHGRMLGRVDLVHTLTRWAWTHEQLRVSWDGRPCTALMIAMSEYLNTVDKIIEVIGEADRMLEAGKSNDPPLRPMLESCGCLRNDADAHRVGCPDHPEGVRGS